MFLMINELNECPCGSGQSYLQCCAPFHRHEKWPTRAELLMRSRYSAYCLKNSDYLLATWDLNQRPQELDLTTDDTEWLKLEIVSSKQGQAKDERGTVAFRAYYRQAGVQRVLSEISRFKKNAGRWFYVDGKVSDSDNTMPNRKAPCPCGSGKKYKHCCGND